MRSALPASTIALLTALLLGACANADRAASVAPQPGPPKVIGGDRDEHGCLVPAGFSWCETEHACVRPWELARTKGFDLTKGGFAAYCAVR